MKKYRLFINGVSRGENIKNITPSFHDEESLKKAIAFLVNYLNAYEQVFITLMEESGMIISITRMSVENTKNSFILSIFDIVTKKNSSLAKQFDVRSYKREDYILDLKEYILPNIMEKIDE